MIDNELIKKTIDWMITAQVEIEKAGGDPRGVLHLFSPESLNCMVRNNIHLVYKKPANGKEV